MQMPNIISDSCTQMEKEVSIKMKQRLSIITNFLHNKAIRELKLNLV